MTTCSSSLSGSFHASRFDTSSAPVMKYQSSLGEFSLRIPTVSTLCIGRPASISTLSTLKRSFPSTAASTMARRSVAAALTLDASLCGGMPPGTKTTRARSSSVMTCSATIICPWCTGSKVPPKIPSLTPTSLEVKHRLADPDLIAWHGASPPQGSEYPDSLQLVLKALDALSVAPVCPEGEPLDDLPGDDVATVLGLDPDPLPGWPEDAMLGLRQPTDGALTHLAQPLLEGVAQRCHTFRRGRGDLMGIRKDFPQVRPELLVEEVDLVQDNDRGLLREPGCVELGPERAFGPFGVFARVKHERQ